MLLYTSLTIMAFQNFTVMAIALCEFLALPVEFLRIFYEFFTHPMEFPTVSFFIPTSEMEMLFDVSEMEI